MLIFQTPHQKVQDVFHKQQGLVQKKCILKNDIKQRQESLEKKYGQKCPSIPVSMAKCACIYGKSSIAKQKQILCAFSFLFLQGNHVMKFKTRKLRQINVNLMVKSLEELDW